jgi:hypothetical protein
MKKGLSSPRGAELDALWAAESLTALLDLRKTASGRVGGGAGDFRPPLIDRETDPSGLRHSLPGALGLELSRKDITLAHRQPS